MQRSLISVLALACLITACTTSKERLLPAGKAGMLEVWGQQTDGGAGNLPGRRLLDARMVLRRPVSDPDSAQEFEETFPRLPNPDLVMYVFPHLSGGNTPIPGYRTVFPMFGSVQYALPGERHGH